jgi:hypothetical protein
MINTNLNIQNQNIDKYEFYSFSIYMYGYGFFYLYLFEFTFLKIVFYNLLINVFLNYSINHNILKFITHKYWKNNLANIAIPQLISCSTTLITYNHNKYLIIPLNILIYYFINKTYKKEINYSKNLRLILLIILLSSKIII